MENNKIFNKATTLTLESAPAAFGQTAYPSPAVQMPVPTGKLSPRRVKKIQIKALLLSLLLVSSLALKAQKAKSDTSPVKHVLLISIDGFRPEFYLDQRWPAPNLQRLMREGSYAGFLRPVFPSNTYPDHTTMITGAQPARHGIYANSPFEPLGQTGHWYWEYNYVQCPTIWDALHKAGRVSAAVQWPVTVGAPIDYNIPEIWPTDNSIRDKKAYMLPYCRPAGIWEELEKNATGFIPPEEVYSGSIRMDEDAGRMASYLMTKYKPAFTTLHLIAIDETAHATGRNSEAVKLAVASVDGVIADVLESLEKSGMLQHTAILIAGDHGFVDVHTILNPNIWLKDAGLSGTGKNWKVKFKAGGGSAFLYLQDPGDKKSLEAVRQLISSLPEKEKKLFRVIPQEDMRKIGADPHAVLALSPVNGISFAGADTGGLLQGMEVKGTHGYYPDFPEIMTGFICYGAGIKKGNVIPEMNMADIAPVIAALLNLRFESPDGILLPGILTPEIQLREQKERAKLKDQTKE